MSNTFLTSTRFAYLILIHKKYRTVHSQIIPMCVCDIIALKSTQILFRNVCQRFTVLLMKLVTGLVWFTPRLIISAGSTVGLFLNDQLYMFKKEANVT